MRWLLTSWGSRGDLHPFLALGRGLRARGQEVTLVGHPDWGEETAVAGLRFVPTNEPPRGLFLREHPEIVSTKRGGLTSLRALIRLAIAPSFRPMLETLLAEAPAHDVIVAHHFSFPAPLAAELSGRPWATVTLAPGIVPSAYTRPSSQSAAPGKGLVGRAINRLIWAGGKWVTQAEIDPLVNRMRAECGLAPIRGAMFSAHSPRLNLQLYSPLFAPRPPDWSAEKRCSGFCPYDPPGSDSLAPELEEFLRAGEPPILFTLGSSAVQTPGSFYDHAVQALAALGQRGVLLHGPEENRPARLPTSIMAWPYASFGALMPRLRAVVHQGGIGTVSHVLRAGVSSVVHPFAFDQPGNARRLRELGVAEVVLPHQRTAPALTDALRCLLAGPATDHARKLGERIRAEDGVGRSCEVLEEVFGSG